MYCRGHSPWKEEEEKEKEEDEEENGAASSRLEDFWYPVGEDQWRCHVRFLVNGQEKVFYVYSDDVEEMRKEYPEWTPRLCSEWVYEYRLKML